MKNEVRAKKEFSLNGSAQLYGEALKYLPAGTGSNARLWRSACPIYSPCTVFIDRAKGSRIWDVDGNQYIDYRLGYGPVILGHSYKPVVDVVHRADREGAVYALGNELEIVLAKKVVETVPSAEMVRFASSGTEATMSALRIARGFTKKDKLIKFEGHYHGSHDAVLWSSNPDYHSPKDRPIADSWGIPEHLAEFTIIEEWNDFEGIERAMRKHHKEVAALICEPVMGNATCIPPQKDFLKHLRELCTQYDVLLIFDEVKTGFRLAMGGAQQVYKVMPDLSCFAKSLGNGYPIAAVTGEKEVMDVIGPGKVLHGGTYSANPISLAASIETLEELEHRHVHEKLEQYGKRLIKGIKDAAQDKKVPMIVQGHPAMFQFIFTDADKIRNYRELAKSNMEFYSKVQFELLRRGVMVDEDGEEVIFTSYAHSKDDLDHTISAFEDALTEALAKQVHTHPKGTEGPRPTG